MASNQGEASGKALSDSGLPLDENVALGENSAGFQSFANEYDTRFRALQANDIPSDRNSVQMDKVWDPEYEIGILLSVLKRISNDLVLWKAKNNEIADQQNNITSLPADMVRKGVSEEEGKLPQNSRLSRNVTRLLVGLENAIEDFEDYESTIESTESSESRQARENRQRDRRSSKLEPDSKPSKPEPEEEPPFQTILNIDTIGMRKAPLLTSLPYGHPPAKFIPPTRMPSDAQCTFENWQEFLPFLDLDRVKPQGIALFDIQNGVQLADIPVVFVLESNGHVFRIHSPYLKKKIREVIEIATYPDVDLHPSYISIARPFAPIFHHLDHMKELILGDPDAPSLDKNYFMAFCHFFEVGPGKKPFDTIRAVINEGLIYYEQLWALFKPGDYVVFKEDFGNIHLGKTASLEWQEDKRSTAFVRLSWHLKSLQMVWTGDIFERRRCIDRMDMFKGTTLITDLPYYPLSHHPESEEARETVRIAGRKWSSLCVISSKVMTYQGRAQRFRSGAHTTPINANVIIDKDSRSKIFEVASLNDFKVPYYPEIDFNPFDLGHGKVDIGNFDEDDYLICPAAMPVFSMDDNEWYRVDTMKLSERTWRPESFDRLVFDPTKKSFLKHLTGRDLNARERYSRDAIAGKGRGTILLLHGPPGVGKTMTAEVLSELTRKPLYKVHLGKLSEHQNWEQSLEQIFSDAESWDAILLIDEAEIVLEKRTFERATQNSWISVFLRKLEYYKGLIILTTNMINNIDEAFESRISYPVQFPGLTLQDRKTIWTDFINDLKMLPHYKKELLGNVDTWAEAKINGRQIRNIVTMAQNLASSNDGTLTSEHIDDILNVTLEFTSQNRKNVAKKKKDQFQY